MLKSNGTNSKIGIKEIKDEKPSGIITNEGYEALKETIEALSDNNLIQSIAKTLADP